MPQPLILVVDDDPFNADVLEEVLENLDCSVITAFSGEEAIATAKAKSPQLVLLDVIMPIMDGPTTCQNFKADPHLNAIPIIFVTALDDVDITTVIHNTGAVGYISKPFQPNEMIAYIQKYLG